MADRFWVGGVGTWNTSSTTNWSTTSGGPNGASVPTVADNVFFDQAGTYTVTMTGALACLDITVSAGTVTFADGTSPTLQVRGSMTLLAGTVWSSVGGITFTSTTTGRTITTNGVSFSSGSIGFSGIGGFWTLGSALTATNATLSISFGTLDTSSVGNYAITCSTFAGGGINARTVNFNNSTITCTGNSSSAINLGTITNLTFNAGTSQINLTGSTSGISSAGLTFYNVAFTSTTAATKTITGTNTFNNLSVTGPASAGVTTVTFDSRQTINGTLSTTGTAGNRRVFFTTANYGISQDLVVNSAPSLTDADFRGLYVRGTAAPISGTRIGNRGECRGITFSTPKTVYWNLAGAQNWSANAWATTSTGTPSTDNFPLPQDTATFTNAGSVTGTITLDSAILYIGSIDMSARTSAMTISFLNLYTVYGNWTNGSGVTFTGTSTLTFSGGTTQTITSAGRTFTCPITIDTYGGTVQLADAFDCGSQAFNLSNGTFDTQGYSMSTGSFNSQIDAVRALNFRNSTVSVQSFNASTTQKLNFNAGTSTLEIRSNVGALNISATGELTFYNVSWTSVGAQSVTITGLSFTCNNLFFTAPVSVGIGQISFATTNVTINGTLTCAGASAVRRVFLQSGTIGAPRTITAAVISATDCDFRDINLAGAASGASPTRAGDCGGNTGITFPAPKTVYWNLAGGTWSATGWCTASGGTPDINQFPLAQDTAVFDNAGSAGTVQINAAWNIGTFDASLRTSAMTFFTSSNNPVVYGDWKFGTGVTSSSATGTITFSKNGTQTITSNGVQFGCPVTINHPLANVQLADALSLGATRTLTITTGTFDAVTYNVTTGLFLQSVSVNTVKMGSGTWTLSGTGSVWLASSGAGINLIAGTSTIVLSDTSTGTRVFNGANNYYNKLTIGGATGSSTLFISNASTIFGELASTKTVAHTITIPNGFTTTIGKWSVTGSAGNVVTVNSATATFPFTLVIAGPANSGIDYLSIRDCTVATTSPGEFYVGANSTNVSGNTGVIFTATPAPRTLYWVGGTGNWSSTTKWDTTSGGGGGAAIPTSLDAVNFNSASNATAYTATIDAGVALARCASFTMAGPASGNVTFAGTVGIAFHGNVSFAATGITRTYSGAMNWAGNSSYTFTTNGLSLASFSTVIGIGSTWELGSSLTTGSITTTYGTFSTSASNYNVTSTGAFFSNNLNIRSINLNGSTTSFSGTGTLIVDFTNATNLTFNSGTSQINLSASVTGVGAGGSLTFNNVSFTSTVASTLTINGANTFNTLSFAGRTSLGIAPVTFNADQTISTLTLNAGTASAYRTFLASDTIGTTRTLTVGTLTAGAADIDFRDITIAGAAAPISGTRFGDAKGNSGITFPAAKTVYWALATSNNWGNTGAGSWSATSGGSAAADQFPLAQDIAFIPFARPNNNQTITVNANYNIGTLDMNERNGSALVTLATGTTTPAIYGNWINGTGTTLSAGTNFPIIFAGRTLQTLTSAGKTFPQPFTINTPGGAVTLQDAFINSATTTSAITLISGTFDASGYNVTLNTSSSGVTLSGTTVRTLAFGAGTWIVAGVAGFIWNSANSTNLTVTGTGIISMTGASAKTFAGGGANYSGITLNQGGAGALTITGNNTFKDITNTYSATGATAIALGATTQTLTSPWTATGAATRVLTVSGTSAASPGTLIFSGGGQAANVDYLAINNVRAYDLVDEWYAGPNSTNGGSLGWYFIAKPSGNIYAVFITESASGVDAVLATVTSTINSSVSEAASGIDAVSALGTFGGSVIESASGVDAVSALAALNSAVAESASGVDVVSALASLGSAVSEAASGVDAQSATITLASSIAESASAIDAVAGGAVFTPIILESASGVDTVTSSAQFGSAVAETAGGVDTASSLATLGSAVSETASGVDDIASSPVYTQSIIEAASGVDAVESAAVFTPVISETASGLDSISGFAGLDRTVSETATAVTSIDSIAVLGGTIAETASGVDTTLALASLGSAVSETASGVDTVAGLRALPGDISETASGVDSSSASPVLASLASETASGIDAVSTLTVLVSVASETASGLDSNASTVVFTSSASETASGIDTVSSLATFGGIVLETASGIDSTVGFISFPSSVAEAASGVDTASGSQTMVANAAEAASGVDAASTIISFGSAVSENSSGADAISARALFGSAISEASSGVDAAASSAIQLSNVAETASGADSQNAVAVFQSQVTEASSAQDIVLGFMLAAAQISESASGADQVSALRDLAAAVVEAVSGADAVSASAVFQGILQEIATLTDSVNAPGSTYSAPVVELATLQDAVQAAATFPSAIIEAATGAEENSAAFTPLAVISESATATDIASALAVFAAQTAESANIADEVSPPGSIYNAIVLAVAQMLDQVNPPGSIYNAQVLESATLADSLIGAFLWIDINDDQVANWGDINNVQTTTWLAVDDSQTTNWQNVNNTQTSGWTDVDDTQTPGWNPVLP